MSSSFCPAPPPSPIYEEYKGKFLRLLKEGTWEYVERVNAQGAVMIAAVTTDEELIVIEEYRVPLHAYTLALPAGISGDEGEESFLTSAQRELLEETGYISSHWQYLCEGPSSPGLTTEMVAFFLAKEAEQVEAGGGLESEDITVHKIPLKDIHSWLFNEQKKGKILDPKIFLALYFLGQTPPCS